VSNVYLQKFSVFDSVKTEITGLDRQLPVDQETNKTFSMSQKSYPILETDFFDGVLILHEYPFGLKMPLIG
jgi:hypothetical protein